MLVEMWRVTGSTRLQDLAVKGIKFESNFNAMLVVYMQLVCTQLMSLSNAGSCVGPLWGALLAA
eukprot:1160838-Pelagomonas_calceolata.AAC.4